jgi:hypothetical protein
VAFNLLRTQESEIELLQKDPDEFVQLALDTCDKQKSKIVKTQAAKLLEAMCDNVDGAVSFVTLFSCQSISLAMGSGSNSDGTVDSIEALHEYFYQNDYLLYKDSQFLSGVGTSPEVIAETCLVALTTISYILPRRTDLVPIFEVVLAVNIDRILGLNQL